MYADIGHEFDAFCSPRVYLRPTNERKNPRDGKGAQASKKVILQLRTAAPKR
jgi:hypothetical protein